MNKFQEKCEFLKLKIQQTESQIKTVLENITSDLLLSELKFRLSNQKGKLEFIRPNTPEDIHYREKQIHEFSQKINKASPNQNMIVFHGTPIYNAKKIIQTGKIVSGKDLWGFSTSGDPAGQFSVTTKDNIRDTILGHSDLNAFIGFLPAGVIFVINSQSEQEYQMAKIKGRIFNVNFKENPERIHSLITTPENITLVQNWLKQNNYSYPVCDYDSFIVHIPKKLSYFPVSCHQKNIA